MFVVLIAFLCPVMHAASNIIDAHLANNVFTRLPTLTFYNCLTSFFASLIVLFFGMPQWVGWSLIPLLLVVGMIEVFYQLPYYHALRLSDTSVVSAWFSLGYVLVPVLAYLVVDEKLNFIQYFGFGVLIVSNIVLNIDTPRQIKFNKSFFLMLVSSSILAVECVLFKYALESIDWISAVFYTAVISTLTSFVFMIRRRDREDIAGCFRVYRLQFKVFGLNEVISQVGNIASIFALSALPVVVVESINASQPLFVLLFGVIFYSLFGSRFHENVSKIHVLRKSMCFAFIVLGVYLVLK